MNITTTPVWQKEKGHSRPGKALAQNASVFNALTNRPNASQKGQLLFLATLALKVLFCVSRQDLKAECPSEGEERTRTIPTTVEKTLAFYMSNFVH